MTEKLPELKRTSWIILLTCVVLFLLSLFFWIKNFPGIRRCFIFKSSDSDIMRIENRFEPMFPISGKIQNYIDELLVGPVSEHCTPVFSKGTTLKDCFVRGSKLYVNLSSDLLKTDAYNTDFKAQINVFKLNIMANFRYIKEIEVFIDGKVPFEKENNLLK